MNHPGLMLIPVLMLGDYLLTVAGASLRNRGHDQHIRITHYELNPVWQKAIARKRWVNLRHLGLVALVCAGIYRFDDTIGAGDDVGLAFVTGLLLGAFSAVNGRHLANLATFRRVQTHPDDIEGAITLSHEYVLRTSLYQYLSLLLPLVLLFLCQPTPLLAGSATGIALLMLLHMVWGAWWRHRRTGPT